MLSQFAGEDEVLFPPCTLLTVKPPSSHAAEDVVSLKEVVQLTAKRHNGELTTDDMQQFKLRHMGEKLTHKAPDGTEKSYLKVTVVPTYL